MSRENIRTSESLNFKGNSIKFGRIMGKSAIENDGIVERMTDLANMSLPKNYDRLTKDYFTNSRVITDKKVEYDLDSQWSGNSYLARNENGLIVGFCVGNLFTESGQLNGFGRLVVVEESVRRTGVGQTLMYLLVNGFLYEGVTKIKGSTSVTNSPLRSLAEKFPVIKSLNLSWVRYSISSQKAKQILNTYEEKHPEVRNVWESLK